MRNPNLVERLLDHVAAKPDRVALCFLESDDVTLELTYAGLDARARALAALLQDRRAAGERALILLPSGLDYAVAFYGCLYSGVIAVPVHPPDEGSGRHSARLAGILRDAAPRFILTERALRADIESQLPLDRDREIIEVDAVPAVLAGDWHEQAIEDNAIAFLQYTSGSTSEPKGVCVSHGNLAANELAIAYAGCATESSIMMSWLPFHHDMGLIGGLLNPLYVGYTSVLMSPTRFLQRPVRWLEAITRFGATCSAGPDFAYALCADRVSDASLARLDLSTWQWAPSGSEFVRYETLRRFAERFRSVGFNPRALHPVYGLAEGTLIVSGSRRQTEPVVHTLDSEKLATGRVADASEGSTFVACGEPVPHHEVRIMRTDGSGAAEPDEIGEIWVAGPSVALGYWQNSAATERTFVGHEGRRWLRTGDLGFLREGAVVVTGRMKDILIVRGQNLYPTDIERAVEADVDTVRRGRVAAFPVEIDGRETIGVAAEFGRGVLKRVPAEELAHAIGQAVFRQTDEQPAVIALLNPHALPLTTSGKLQRSACKAGLKDNTLDIFAVFERGRRRDGNAEGGEVAGAQPATETEGKLAAIWAGVLRTGSISRDDDFFVLGGDSVAAAQVVAEIRNVFGVEPPLRLAFEAPTLAAFAGKLDELRRGESAAPVLPPIPPLPSRERTELSHAQERLWFLWNMDPDGTAYTVASTIRLRGSLDHARLSRAINEIVRRHEVLRTTFVADEGGARAVLHETMDVEIHNEDIRHVEAGSRKVEAEQITRRALSQPFDLVEGPLLRAVLIRIGDDEHELLLLAHHIAADGWSLSVLLEELAGLYRGYGNDTAEAPPRPPIQYADFAAWQRRWLADGEGERQLAHWRSRLGDTHPVLALPHDRPRPPEQSHRGATIEVSIDPSLVARLRELAGNHHASLFMVLLAAYQALLHRFTGQDDIRVGVPVAGRRHAACERLIGCFVNTLVMRAEIGDRMRFSELLAEVKETALAALSHQELPFEQLVDALGIERSGAHNPLFQAKFNYMAAPRGFDGVEGLSAETRIVDLAGSHFDLALDVVDGGDAITTTFNFATDLFDVETVERFAQAFVTLLNGIADKPDKPISDLDIGAAARQAIASETVAFPASDVLSLYRAAASARATELAVRCGDAELTFGELERRSNALARRLVASGVGRDRPVALWIDRSPAFVVALLGVMKAGGAYVPLESRWPIQRVKDILREGSIGILIAAGESLEASRALDCVLIDADEEVPPEGDVPALPGMNIHPEQTAYIIYTSGSTGAPKGVAVSHGALANYVQALLARVQPAPGASMAMASTVAADLGHTVLFGALTSGATLNLIPQDDVFDAALFAGAMRDGNVGVLKIVPSHLRGLMQATRSAHVLPRDVLILGGEVCDPELLSEIRRRRPECRIVNHYGPTETTVGAVAHVCAADELHSVPIGQPLANLRACVLDDCLNAVPGGVAGELYIGGAGVARGYHLQPGLTAERFVPDPSGQPGARLYRTGDRVRCDRLGRIHFLGRADDQIKLRGYRIELGEVERAVKGIDGIDDAVAVVRAVGEGEQRHELVAYCVPASRTTIDPNAIRDRLAERLPDYMVPARIVALAKLPLTANGKVDRKALPEASEAQPASASAAPQGEVEETIAAVWKDVLGQTEIGRNDNFFEIGGDSILSLQIITRLRKRGIRVTPKQLFGQQTIAALATVATVASPQDAARTKPGSSAAAAPKDAAGAQPLLPIQVRFFEQQMTDRHHWNQALLLRPNNRLDWSVFRRALSAVVAHHDALSLRFEQTNGSWRAKPCTQPKAEDLLWVRNGVGVGDELSSLIDEAQKSLSLSGPLLRAVAVDLTDGSQRLFLAIHHLVVDGVSWRILLEDLATAYERAKQGATDFGLAATGTSFAAWATRLQTFAKSEALAAELPYWLERRAAQELPCDSAHDGADLIRDCGEVSLAIDDALTSRLLTEAPAAYRTQVSDLLLAALARAVHRWSGLDDVMVELEGHGREDLFDDVDLARTVGWFTTAFPVRIDGASRGEADLIASVKETLRAIPNRGLGYGVLRYLGTTEQRSALAMLDAPRIVFNYLGQLDGTFGDALPFSLATESAGAMRSPDGPLRGWLNINAEVREGQLRLSFGFGSKRYRRETVEALSAHFAQSLREIVDHCTGGATRLTPSDVPLAGLAQDELDRIVAMYDGHKIEDIYPLSPMQLGMLFHALRGGEEDDYVNQISVELSGVDAKALRAAWQTVSDRHAVLRSGFVWRDAAETARQVVCAHLDVPFEEEDWTARAGEFEAVGDEALAPALAEAGRHEREKGFDVAKPPVQRVRLIRLGPDRYWLIWTHHHIVLDGWSSARIFAEVLRLARGETLPPVRGRYRDYIAWLQERDETASLAYWRDALAKLDSPTLLSDAFAASDEASETTGAARLSARLDAAQTRRLIAFARQERVTLNTLVQGAWAQLLRRYTGRSAVSFGVTVAGRPEDLASSEDLVGLFINTLPVVDGVSPEARVGEWLRGLQEQNVAMREHSWTPLYEIQRNAGHGGRTVFDTILVFENYPIGSDLRGSETGGPRIGRVEHVTPTNYALAIGVFAGAETVDLDFNYDRGRFTDAQVRELQQAFAGLLSRLAESAEARLGNVAVARAGPPREESVASTPKGPDVVRQIEIMAAKVPWAPAIFCGEQDVSYGTLNAAANRLARRLRHRGIGPDQLVGLAVPRSPEMIVALLAVLKAGGAYLPLDPDYPDDRLLHMIRDSGAKLVLANGEVRDGLARVLHEAGAEIWQLAGALANGDGEHGFRDDDLDIDRHPESIAYVIYTSGSTGTPKGVAVAHGPLAMHCHAIGRLYGMTAADREYQTASINFDIAHERWLVPLMTGGSIVLSSNRNLDVADLLGEIDARSVTSVFLPPAYADELSDALRRNGKTLKLRLCIVGGEAWSEAGVKAFRDVTDVGLLVNAYGPTETVIAPTAWPVDEAALIPGRIAPIGKPVGARTARILDGDLNPVPVGVTGELFIGGAGLARGYLKKSAMTAERFVPDPSGGAGARLYRTGDLARWRADGVIEYAGRADNQIKIRGFRIEPGEIEARMLAIAGVQSAAVIVSDTTAGRQLIGYVTGESGLDGRQVRDALAGVLPDYMVPSAIVVLDRLPLTANGKIDRRALPSPSAEGAVSGDYEAPEGDMEVELAAIWSELLGAEQVGRHDNFFELGGHSLLAVRLMSRVAQTWDVSIPVSDLFRHPELADFSRVVSIAVVEQNLGAGELRELIDSELST
jgi:amino acid adenylation domain-containing protein/non-ribosomal peptide synthase protein (TIGR01720 family)